MPVTSAAIGIACPIPQSAHTRASTTNAQTTPQQHPLVPGPQCDININDVGSNQKTAGRSCGLINICCGMQKGYNEHGPETRYNSY